MGILYLFVLTVAVGIGGVLGAFIGLTVGLMSAPFTAALLGLVAGAFFGLFAGLILVIRVHRDYIDAATPPGEMKSGPIENVSPKTGVKCEP
jgi:hypothetical protein